MGKQFFSGWVLWEKFVFVLACAIVATILLGLVKVQYDKYKLRKYAMLEQMKAEQTPEMLEAQPTKEEEDDAVPFGIRAIESGIEIDGVWISRSNTPVTSSRSSITDVKLARSDISSQPELPKAAHASSSRASSKAPSSAFDRAVSAERIPTNDSRSSSPGRETPNPFRGRPPVSNYRYSNPNIQRNSTTLQALEGQVPGSSSARYVSNSTRPSPSNSGKSSIRSSDDSDYMQTNEGRPYEAAYINPNSAAVAVPMDPRTDLNLLQSHRLSHVAETGQLTPRVRRPGHSGEWASVAENRRSPQEISTTNGVDYFMPRQKTPSPPLPALPHAVTSPDDTAIPSSSRSSRDGHAANHARQSIPLLETYVPEPTYAPEAYQPRGPQHTYEEDDALYNVATNQNQRQTQILRKVNSGFEILRPGTFGEPPSPEEDKLEKRQSKKLQKRRKTSDGSRTSHFVEQV